MTVKDLANVVDGLTVLYEQQMRSAPAGSLSEMKSTGAYNAMIALRAMIKDEEIDTRAEDVKRLLHKQEQGRKALEELGKVRKSKGDNS